VDEDVDVAKLLGQQRAKHLRFGADDDDSDDEWGMDDEEVESALDKVIPKFLSLVKTRNPALAQLNRARRTHTHTHTHDTVMAHTNRPTHTGVTYPRAGSTAYAHVQAHTPKHTDRHWWCCMSSQVVLQPNPNCPKAFGFACAR